MESEKPEVTAIYSSHSSWVLTVCFSPDQTKLCSAGYDNKVVLTNLQNNQTEKVFTVRDETIWGSDFSCNGEFLVTGSGGVSCHNLQIWKVPRSERGKFSTVLEGFDVGGRYVYCVLYLRKDPNHIISGGDDETIKIMNVERKIEISTLLGCEGNVTSVDILPDNRTVVSGDGVGDVRIWDLRSEKCVKTLDHHKDDVNSVQFHPNSFSLASGSYDQTIKIFDFRTFKLLQNYKEHFNAVYSVCFHPSGKYLLSGSADKTIKVFDLFEKKVLFSLKDHSNNVRCVKFSPDGKLFASASWDTNVFVWNFPLGRNMFNDSKMDEEERVKYLAKDLDDHEDDCYERNVLKVKIDHFCSLYFYKFLLNS